MNSFQKTERQTACVRAMVEEPLKNFFIIELKKTNLCSLSHFLRLMMRVFIKDEKDTFTQDDRIVIGEMINRGLNILN